MLTARLPKNAVDLLCTAEVTLSALNAPDVDVDVEGLGDQSAGRKLDFDSGVCPFRRISVADFA